MVAIVGEIDTATMAGFRDALLFFTLLDTGCRISELTEARLDNLDLAAGTLKVQGKGDQERIVPVGKRVTKLLTKWLVKYRPAGNRDGYPTKAVKLLYKRYAGYPLDNTEQSYLYRFVKKAQKSWWKCHKTGRFNDIYSGRGKILLKGFD